MTLLVSWAGVDTHGTASAYIASDSRISWGDATFFDQGRKVFAFRNSPDILGYCGDVLFPTMVLSQAAEMADRGLLFPAHASCKTRFESIKETLVHQLKKYPWMTDGLTAGMFEVIHIARDQNGKSVFETRLMRWSVDKGWSGSSIDMPRLSDILFVRGSGSNEFFENLDRYRRGPDHGTSRSIFHCFCDTLANISDVRCGGAPQLVGVYRKPDSATVAFGIIHRKERYFLGAPVRKDLDLSQIEWRNERFELCDGKSMARLPHAQSQPDPLKRA